MVPMVSPTLFGEQEQKDHKETRSGSRCYGSPLLWHILAQCPRLWSKSLNDLSSDLLYPLSVTLDMVTYARWTLNTLVGYIEEGFQSLG